MPARRPRTFRALLGITTLCLTTAGAGAFAASKPAAQPSSLAVKTPFALVQDRAVGDRLAQPEDRYAVAGGCYTVEAPGQGFVSEDGGALSVSKDPKTAEPFHFQATKLGEYLLATNEGRDTTYKGAWWDKRGYVSGGSTAGLIPSDGVAVAQAPSEDAEWRLVAAGRKKDAKNPKGQTYVLSLPARDATLAVRKGQLTLVDDPKAGTPLRLRHVADDNPKDADANGTACATWPEIDTNAVGTPQPVTGGPNAPVKGFFEAHVHGMAYEFLGGELRCGSPWHKYGVEFALGRCNELNGALEVPLGGQPPTDPVQKYDPVGWPTFSYWPQNHTLTHEQYYWRWLERAYLGGLRLTTNLLVDNTALCQAYPLKKNSCNEMDTVRLEAKRMFELQDYIDAQSGGPGEGWLRVVTSPAQARQTINAGRLAIVLGIEVSSLFDCDEVLDQPQCTEKQIDTRLQEVFDMGVRQMELVNKFDNALSGVTGDGGTTGIVVNNGNHQVTGHWWDMQLCPVAPPHNHGDVEKGDQHDKTQLSATDVTPGEGEGIDALAGRVLDTFGGATKRAVAPLYGPGPHCNSRGLTKLGEHLIRSMIAKGMVFDPDHMSASAQRSALDLVEDQLVPAAKAKAKRTGTAPVLPAVISSHSWGNEAVYQRIYEQDGVVAPRTDDAGSFVKRWQVLRGYAAAQAPAGYDFGMGYGADTNGLGGQPTPRTGAKNKLDYSTPFAAPIGGVTLRQQKSGFRTFDINTEGVAQYGMFADWFRELRIAADELKPGLGNAITRDMLNGSETYLGLWERAVYGGNSCVTDGSMPQVNDLHAALGLNLDGFLDAIGQPADRTDDAYVYCAKDDSGNTQVVDVLFDATGRASDVRPSASGVTVTGPTSPAPHDHGAHSHGTVGGVVPVTVPADGELALGALLVVGLTGIGAGSLTGRYRLG